MDAEAATRTQANGPLVEPRPVSKLNFLIHPGFGSDPDVMELSSESSLEWNAQMLNKYAEAARNMKSDELVMAFTHSRFRELRRDLSSGKSYVQGLDDLRSILGNRLIVLTSEHNIFEGDEALEVGMRDAQNRGFRIGSSTPTIAFGESELVCVPDAAENLNRAGGFEEPTRVVLSLTNASLYGISGINEAREILKKEYGQSPYIGIG